jgi:amino acid transporter
VSLIALRRKKPDIERPFKLKPSFGWIPLIALLGAIVCVGLLFTFDWVTVLIQSIIIIIGMAVYYLMKYNVIKKPRQKIFKHKEK